MEEKSKDGSHKYKLHSIYKYPIPPNFDRMNKGLYKYMTPLVLYFLVNGHDENNSVKFTIGRWAREIKMVNQNYDILRYNVTKYQHHTMSDLGLDDLTRQEVSDYYKKSDELLRYYLLGTLDYLKKSGRIIWRESYKIQKTEISKCDLIDNSVNTTVTIIESDATDADMKIYAECVGIADEKIGIVTEKERYYSEKSSDFFECLQRELNKRNIRLIYKTYEAYYTNLDKCNDLLSHFEVNSLNDEKMVRELNELFAEKLTENAANRFIKHPLNFLYYDDQNELRRNYGILNDIVLNQNAERIKFKKYDQTMAESFNSDITVRFTHE
jgi:hypothetical protein